MPLTDGLLSLCSLDVSQSLFPLRVLNIIVRGHADNDGLSPRIVHTGEMKIHDGEGDKAVHTTESEIPGMCEVPARVLRCHNI